MVATTGSVTRLALILGGIAVVVLAALVGWLGVQTLHANQDQQRSNEFLQVGRQAALSLTTINYQTADADVQRILDASTDSFYDDFQQRSQAFVEVVKKAQSASVGTISESGLESASDTDAQVLVAVSVKTTTAAAAVQPLRAWRMRISVSETAEGPKVSNVEFVP